jgi:hypothetical protein
MVPRSIAYRCWAACLGSQARRLRRLTSAEGADESERAHGRAARTGHDRKSIGRRELADRLSADAATISGWIGDSAHRGPEIDPTLFALIVCYLYRHGDAIPALRRWAGLRGDAARIDHADPANVPAYLERLLEVR